MVEATNLWVLSTFPTWNCPQFSNVVTVYIIFQIVPNDSERVKRRENIRGRKLKDDIKVNT